MSRRTEHSLVTAARQRALRETCGKCGALPDKKCRGLKRHGFVHRVRQAAADETRARELGWTVAKDARVYVGAGAHRSDCEHCDGLYSRGFVRQDRVRGSVCRHCDGALDA